MSEVKITGRLTVAGQPDPQAFRDIAARGYATLVNLRPDGEEPSQPGNAVERMQAAGAGMAYGFVPVTGPTIGQADVEAFRNMMQRSQGPVYAHCKSGTRALTLYALAEVMAGRMKAGEVQAFGKEHGFDLSGAVRWLEREAGRVPRVTGFYEPRTFSIQYVVTDPATKRCALIDPVLYFDEKSGATATTSADALLAYVEQEGLTVEWILDTHPHADHFSAAHYLKGRTGAPTAIGVNITGVQALWKDIYNWPELKTDGSCWDRLFAAGDTFHIGSLEGRVLFSPG
ncbi:MAG: TIGR01244 family sulfur transferase, partial [Rhizobiaceae bacterium]